ncbi:SDR family NAD(P)-dependent oxidoreductase [Microbacterium radiodurans]|uniref:SDR family NAD(P)-dependent oxidoreductase n=1 Tax=Microbacterium radiodurans TaxID=661398 RepID=A0A5J5IPW1_9MICO|nr:SDR family NAD(P)-dependent oxidoreductase [Microbacterium radiodurans]KAA9085472.1 SDR family NAD(P)-dependent oxidoreductase [Microbacterium radiodurans]
MTRRRGPARLSGLAGRTVVIVGASSGIGRGVALRAAQFGADVVVFGRRGEALRTLTDRIADAGGRAHAVVGDAARPGDLERLADEAEAAFGPIDVWIGNAGVGSLGLFWDVPIDDHVRVVETNLIGAMRGAHIALRRFVDRGEGVLVNTASVESVVPLAYQASYAATKAGLLSLTRTLRQELRLAGASGVSVGAVLPWAVRTPFWRHAGIHTGRELRMPLMDEPEPVVDAILHVCLSPRERQPVGWKARIALVGHRLAPGVTAHAAADVARACLRRGRPTPTSSGAVRHPLDDPATVAETPRR